MKVLWLCNMMLPMIAEQFGFKASNKEGWLSGLADVMLSHQAQNGIELYIAFPAPDGFMRKNINLAIHDLTIRGCALRCYGFKEDTLNAHIYDEKLEDIMESILNDAHPDMIHCFGTEYPHTLAMCRKVLDKSRVLITIQGLCSVYANVFEADLPWDAVVKVTLRDFLKKDSIPEQKAKYISRGENEIEALMLAGNIGGRTDWDKHYAKEIHPGAKYYVMKETLRAGFYEGRWDKDACEKHSIFLSQGDYPIKGLHYMLLAMPKILKSYPDARVYVAGNSVISYRTLKDKIKISAYGKYLRSLIDKYSLDDKVVILGKLDSGEMKKQYLKSSLFVCPSAIENSPNSLGEAMILGMPCVTANVGGIPSIFDDGRDGIMYTGTGCSENSFDRDYYKGTDSLYGIADNLADAVIKMWSSGNKEAEYCKNAREHALIDHDRQANYEQTLKVYEQISGAVSI
ncbi:MAG: glycosyltransferase family 4 protein [Lachnospiraceae bacterium]|nr:glycosyltransferase family 4 protein [Lachnospiraceae bacterium]